MNYIEEYKEIIPTKMMLFKVWWSICWRSTLYLFLIVTLILIILISAKVITLQNVNHYIHAYYTEKSFQAFVIYQIIPIIGWFFDYAVSRNILTKRKLKKFFIRVMPLEQSMYKKSIKEISLLYSTMILLINLFNVLIDYFMILDNILIFKYLIVSTLQFFVTIFVFAKKSFKDYRIAFFQNIRGGIISSSIQV